MDEDGSLFIFGTGGYGRHFAQGKHSVKITLNNQPYENECRISGNVEFHCLMDKIKEKIAERGKVEGDLLIQAKPNLTLMDDTQKESHLIHGLLRWKHWKKSSKILKNHKEDLHETLLSDQSTLSQLNSHIHSLEIQFSRIQQELNVSKEQASLIKERVKVVLKEMDQCELLQKWISPWSEKLESLKRPFLETIRSEHFEISCLTSQQVLVFLNNFLSWFLGSKKINSVEMIWKL
jgi:hypothetical protein